MRLSNTLRRTPFVGLGAVGTGLGLILVVGGWVLGVIRQASWSLDAQMLSNVVSAGMRLWVASVFWLGWAAPLLGLWACRQAPGGARLPDRWRSRLFAVPPLLHGLFAAVWTGFTLMVPRSAGPKYETLKMWLFALGVVVIAMALRHTYGQRRRQLALEIGQCPRCDYPTHRSGSDHCPECGEPVTRAQAPPPSTNP